MDGSIVPPTTVMVNHLGVTSGRPHDRLIRANRPPTFARRHGFRASVSTRRNIIDTTTAPWCRSRRNARPHTVAQQCERVTLPYLLPYRTVVKCWCQGCTGSLGSRDLVRINFGGKRKKTTTSTSFSPSLSLSPSACLLLSIEHGESRV
jgi:hypothetical protein